MESQDRTIQDQRSFALLKDYMAVLLVFMLGCVAVKLFSVIKTSDFEHLQVFSIYNGTSALRDLHPSRHFLLEALIPNFYGSLLQSAGLSPIHYWTIWTVSGFLLLYLVCAHYHHKRTLSIFSLVAILLLSGIFKSLLQWIGKPDTYLCAILLLLVFNIRNNFAALVIASLATLCHPLITLISIIGISGPMYLYERTLSMRAIVGALIGIVFHKIIMSVAFEGYYSRYDFAKGLFSAMLNDSINNSICFLIVSLPAFLIVSKYLREQSRSLFEILSVFVVCFVIPYVVALFLTLDHSRVYTMIIFPWYAYVLLKDGERLKGECIKRPALAGVIVLTLLLMPQLRLFTWTGNAMLMNVLQSNH